MAMNREELLALYEGMRVTDVCDGMDALGYQDIGNVDESIKALWKDIDNFEHRIYGFALTVRYLPTNKPQIRCDTVEEYAKAKGAWYREYASDRPWLPVVKKGDIIVIDGSGTHDTGYIGSYNGFAWIKENGATGIITNGGARDTDEIIKQRMPVYCAHITRGIRPGRLEYDGHNIPIELGGVLVRPGDMIVADGDGVIVVPIEIAEAVGKFAKGVQDADKKLRKEIYVHENRELDFTVK